MRLIRDFVFFTFVVMIGSFLGELLYNYSFLFLLIIQQYFGICFLSTSASVVLDVFVPGLFVMARRSSVDRLAITI